MVATRYYDWYPVPVLFCLDDRRTTDMEEGELSDSDCEQLEVSAGAAASQQILGNRGFSASVAVGQTYRRSDVPGLSSESEDCDDSDDDGPHLLKKRLCHTQNRTDTGTFVNPLLHSTHRGPKDLGFSQHGRLAANGKHNKLPPHRAYVDLDRAQDHTARPRKNVWGSVLAEQDITRDIVKFGVDRDLSVLSYRDVEAYEIPKRVRDAPINSDDELGSMKSSRETEMKTSVSKDVEIESDKEAKDQEDLFAMETFGTEAKKPVAKLSIKDRLGRIPHSDSESDSDVEDVSRQCSQNHKSQPEEIDFEKELERYKRKRKKLDKKPKKKSVKDRLGKKGTSKDTLPSGFISVTPEDSKETIVNALVTNLQEPKVDLLTRVVDIVGAKKAICLMSETVMIESTGGLMVNDGSRRRTPGGVFLFLLRNDKHIRKDEIDEIFREERNLDKKHRRTILKAKRVQWAAINLPQDKYRGQSTQSGDGDDPKPNRRASTPAPTMRAEDGDQDMARTEQAQGSQEAEEGEIEEEDLDFDSNVSIHIE